MKKDWGQGRRCEKTILEGADLEEGSGHEALAGPFSPTKHNPYTTGRRTEKEKNPLPFGGEAGNHPEPRSLKLPMAEGGDGLLRMPYF